MKMKRPKPTPCHGIFMKGRKKGESRYISAQAKKSKVCMNIIPSTAKPLRISMESILSIMN
jgi:hypothetical protein